MQPIDLTGVTSVILSTPYNKPIEVPVKVVETIFEIGIDLRDRILALKSEPADLTGTKVFDTPTSVFLSDENKALKERVKVLEEALSDITIAYGACAKLLTGVQDPKPPILLKAKAALTPIE